MSTTAESLRDVLSHEFVLTGTSAAMLAQLKRHPKVVRLRQHVCSGAASLDDVVANVSDLASQVTPGERFFGDPNIAAIAVAVRGVKDPVALNLLFEASRVRCPELLYTHHLARLCLAETLSTYVPTKERSYKAALTAVGAYYRPTEDYSSHDDPHDAAGPHNDLLPAIRVA